MNSDIKNAVFINCIGQWLADELKLLDGGDDSNKKGAAIEKILNCLNNIELLRQNKQMITEVFGNNNITTKVEEILTCREDIRQKKDVNDKYDISIRILALYDIQPKWKKMKEILHTDESERLICYKGNQLKNHELRLIYSSYSQSCSRSTIENQAKDKTIACLKKKISDLESLKLGLERENAELKYKIKVISNENAGLKNYIQSLNATNTQLNNELKKCTKEKLDLKSCNDLLIEEKNELQTLFGNETDMKNKSLIYQTCYKLWQQAKNNEGKTTSKTYDASLKSLYVLFALLGKKAYALLYQTLGFPSYKTATLYKKETAYAHFGNAFDNQSIFNGSEENIKTLVDCFMPININDHKEKAVLVVDAASIRANITIEDSGVVTGLVNPLKLPQDTARDLIKDEEKFKQFCREKLPDAIEAIFVILVAPIDPNLNAFPICEITARNGNANNEITDKLMKIKEYLCSINVDIIGIGSDGDKHYLQSGKHFLEIALQTFEKDVGLLSFS